ncbi:MAG TPA: FKBP-type peptidyl-prolyl cis-trans isomerase [Thermoanaerobaculia bacterium]|nr:FKBP-type peptidyl-prolyl cis-trans isomerase [Thermoanaerobaculia bacterium]
MKKLPAAALALLLAACNQGEPETARQNDGATSTASTEAAATTTTAAADTAAPTGAAMDTFKMPTNLQKTASGLQYSIDRPGTGAQPQAGQMVSVHYTGWLTDGTPFDSSRDSNAPIQFPLGVGRVIRGWDEAIATMKVGEKRTLVIPPDLGYGESGFAGAIPPNATLVFAVELVGVQ